MMIVEVKEMKFSEKLQKLRKENKMSQEQLADQLEVSRQAVSKWESGQTYPEMDKLLSICKLFKCSLDDLTNDEVKEIKGNEKEKVTMSKFLDEILDTISRSASIFRKLSFSQKLKYLSGLLILVFVLVLLRIPVDYIYELGVNIFESFHPSVENVLCSIWNFILSISYLIFSVIVFYYLYKVLFLEKWEHEPIDHLEGKKENLNIPEVEKEKEKESKKESIISEEKESPTLRNHSEIKTSVILKVLNSIASFCVKLCSTLILFPFLFVFFFIVVAIIITLYFMLQGIIYLGIFFLLMGGFILCYLVIQILFSLITSHRQSSRQIGILFLASLITLGIGTGITVVEFSSFTYYDEIPNTELYKSDFAEKEIEMTDGFYFDIIGSYENIEYVKDDDLKNTVRFQVEYYSNFSKVNFEMVNTENPLWIVAESKVHLLNPRVRETIFKNLKNKELYNYGKLERMNIVVFASSLNIDKMQENKKKIESENEKDYYDSLLESNREREAEYQSLIDQKEIENNKLHSKIEELEEQLEEKTIKLQEYKDQISSIITE